MDGFRGSPYRSRGSVDLYGLPPYWYRAALYRYRMAMYRSIALLPLSHEPLYQYGEALDRVGETLLPEVLQLFVPRFRTTH